MTQKKYWLGLLLLLFISLNAFAFHKFYVSIYQIEFVPEKKMLQITSRIFTDDLNAVLSKKYNTKTHIGEQNESPADEELMRKYMLENFIIKINGQQKTINFKSKEIENNVVICYFNCKDISKIKSFDFENKVLFDLNSEQQNIMQLNIYNKKQSILLTSDNPKGVIKP